jgi:acetyl-CoA carboxylase biotin carboxyl carrier protein
LCEEHAVDLKRLTEILDIVDARGIAELELEEGGTRLRVKKAVEVPATAGPWRSAAPTPEALAIASAPTPAPTPLPAAAAPAAAEEALSVVACPIVGTFYRAPDPNSPPYVSVGDRVRVGQVLCIVEAMKLMNEIEAEIAGVIAKIHQENGQPVQYGAPLFSIKQER